MSLSAIKKVNIALSICFPTLTSVTNYLHMVRYELLLHKEPKAIYLSNVVMSYFLAKKRWPIDPLSHLLSNILDKPILVAARLETLKASKRLE